MVTGICLQRFKMAGICRAVTFIGNHHFRVRDRGLGRVTGRKFHVLDWMANITDNNAADGRIVC